MNEEGLTVSIGDFLATRDPKTFLNLDNGTSRRQAMMPPQNLAPIAHLSFVLNERQMTLLFPIGPSTDILAPIQVKGFESGFGIKSDLIVMAIGTSTGKIISQAIKPLTEDQRNDLLDQIENLIYRTNWSWNALKDEKGQPQYWELSRTYPETKTGPTGTKYQLPNRRWSVILLIEMPGLARFYSKLQQLINEAIELINGTLITLPRPLTYITLLVKGACRGGISVCTAAEFEEYKNERW